jgi:hypothetical protein
MKREYPSVKNLEPYMSHGWQWDIGSVHYRTNSGGEGLWKCGTYTGIWAGNYEDRQIVGTCQFELPSSRGAAYQRIRRYFALELPD